MDKLLAVVAENGWIGSTLAGKRKSSRKTRRGRLARRRRMRKRIEREMYLSQMIMNTKSSITKNRERLIFAVHCLMFVVFLYFGTLKPVEIYVDGEPYKALITTGRTAGELLAEAGLEYGEYDEVIPRPDRPVYRNGVVQVKSAFKVFVSADNGTREVLTTAETVEDLMVGEGLELGEHDEINPDLHEELKPYSEVSVLRIEKVYLANTFDIPYESEVRDNPALGRGLSTVLSAGEEGLKEEVVEIVYADGREISREIVGEQVIEVPKNEVIEQGTASTLNRDDISFEYDRVLRVEATAYCPGTPGSGCPVDHRGFATCTGQATGLTATGDSAVAGDGTYENPHIIAVDTSVIPLRSMVYIEGYGFAVALDTGGSIRGHKIDLLFARHQEAIYFGRRTLNVYLLSAEQKKPVEVVYAGDN